MRKAVFGIVAFILPFAVVAAVEIGLRVAGVDSARADPFVDLEGKPGYAAFNPDYPTRYFRSFTPSVSFDPFLRTKDSGVFRVVVLGGSSTAGFPYAQYNAFPAQLRARLSRHEFGRRVEVINLGMTAVNSFALWDLAPHVVRLAPDAVVIYAGHNEYYGAFGVGSTEYGLGAGTWRKRLVLSLKDFVIFRALEDLILGRAKDQPAPDGRTLMARVVRDSGIEFGGDLFNAGLSQFRSNMSRVLDLMRAEGIPVYLGSLAGNLKDQAPLGESRTAVTAFEEAGRLLQAGDTVQAERHFRIARDEDEIRFRAPSQTNELIVAMADEFDAVLVDVESRMTASSASGIPGSDLFDDHLHPNHRGYGVVADAFYEALRSTLLDAAVLPSASSHRSRLDPFDRTHAALQIAMLTGGYPFVKDVDPETSRARFETTLRAAETRSAIDSLAAQTAVKRLAPQEGLRLAVRRARVNADTAHALLMSSGLLYWQPFNDDLSDDLVGFAAEIPAYDTLTSSLAHDVFARTNRLYPLSVLSAVTLRQGELNEAEVMLDLIEQRDPANPIMLYNKARLLLMRGDTLAARAYFERFRSAE